MKTKLFKFKNEFILILFSAIVVGFNSCSPEYIPTMVNTPLLSNKGEVQAVIATGTSNFDFQGAYAITDYLGVMVNGSYANSTSDTTDEYHKHFIMEGALGYYNTFGNVGRYEIYGGYGFGDLQEFDLDALGNGYVDGRFNKIFIQPSVGVATNVFDAGFSPRISFIGLEGGEYSGKYATFFEPTLTAKIGYKYIKSVIQFGFSFPVNDDNVYFDYQPLIFNIGLSFNLGRIWEDL